MHASGWMGRLIAFSLIRLVSSPLMGRLIAFSLSRLLSSPLSSPLSDSLSGPQPSEKGLSDGQQIGACWAGHFGSDGHSVGRPFLQLTRLASLRLSDGQQIGALLGWPLWI